MSEIAPRRSVSITPLAKTQHVDLNKEKSPSSKELAVEVPIEKVKNIPIEVYKSFSVSKNVKDFMAEKAIEAIRKSTITNSKYRMGCSLLTGDNKVITGLFFILFCVKNIFSVKYLFKNRTTCLQCSCRYHLIPIPLLVLILNGH